MSEGQDLENALRGLDQEGWNQRDMIQTCTFARLAATNALIVEEILELSLGLLHPDDVIRRAAEIEIKTNKCWEEVPDFLRLDIKDLWNSQRSALELMLLMVIRLGHLEHRFLLQRTLSKITGSGPSDSHTNLLSVCDELFKFVLLMAENKDCFRDFQLDFVMILAVHGVPTAAILAVELLQQERDATKSSVGYPLHRSEMIQNLSVFVSCLGTVRSEAYGTQSCERGRRFLKTILDMILGKGAAAASGGDASEAHVDDLSDPMFGASLFQPGSDGDFAKWLESMEWEQDVWVNFN